MEIESQSNNPLETEPIGKLMGKFAVPAIIANLVSALYNMVDQIFIGRSIGPLGNAATNVVFPLIMIMTTLAMTLGVGGAANFSLRLGEGDGKKSAKIAGNSIMLMIALGLALSALSILFLKPLMVIFGARDAVLSYSMEYGRIIAVGCPFYVLSVGGSQLIRADGSPRYSMFSALLGAILNIILDPIFIFGLNMGMTGAAIATIIGQFASCAVVLLYLRKFKSVRLQKDCFKPQKETMLSIFSLGFSSGLHQIAVTLFQVVMNNTLIHYGELSEYGRDIPLADICRSASSPRLRSATNFFLHFNSVYISGRQGNQTKH